MPAQLIALSEGPNILLDKAIMLFGRHPECDIQLNSRKISRRHCAIAQVSPDAYVVRDLGSTNGVRINGVKVPEGRLKAGDEVTIGNFKYQVSWDGSAAPIQKELAGPPLEPDADDFLEASDEPIALGDNEVSNVLQAKPAPKTH